MGFSQSVHAQGSRTEHFAIVISRNLAVQVVFGLNVFKELEPSPLKDTWPFVLSHFKQEHGKITYTQCLV